MNGIHDMGGFHGFGRVEVEENEPVFHERWESRVFAMVWSLSGDNIDAGRHSLESVDPVAYFKNGYYGRWLAAFERNLAGLGILTAEEIWERARAPRSGRRTRAPKKAAPGWQPERKSYIRHVDRSPLFAVDDAVVTRNRHPSGHTRLPAYARCRRGVVARVHPAMVYPDDHAHGRGENPQYLYTIRFEGRELWGDHAEPGTVVHVDLFEPYLERAGG